MAFDPRADASEVGADVGAATYADAVLADAPLAYYRLDELTGALAIDSGPAGHDAAYVGTPGLGAQGVVASSRAPVFDGDDYIFVALPVGTTPFVTVEMWMHWNGTPRAIAAAFGVYDLVMWDSPTALGFNTDNSDVWGVVRSDLGMRWVHIVAIFHNGPVTGSRIYVDGVVQPMSQITGATSSSVITTQFFIGRYESTEANGYPFRGTIDEVAVYDYELPADRIAAHFAVVTGG